VPKVKLPYRAKKDENGIIRKPRTLLEPMDITDKLLPVDRAMVRKDVPVNYKLHAAKEQFLENHSIVFLLD